jgi:hypothetical protein
VVGEVGACGMDEVVEAASSVLIECDIKCIAFTDGVESALGWRVKSGGAYAVSRVVQGFEVEDLGEEEDRFIEAFGQSDEIEVVFDSLDSSVE